jgi:hypothetical protein
MAFYRCLPGEDRGSELKTVKIQYLDILIPEVSWLQQIYNSEIPVVNETKFLGLIFDSKLSFKLHIAYLKKCLKAMNLLRVVANTGWGADSTTLLCLYRSIIRSKLDYGCIV